MSEPMWLGGDPVTYSNSFDDVWEVECDCGWTDEVPCSKEYKHDVCYVFANWTCPDCNETHTTETEFEVE